MRFTFLICLVLGISLAASQAGAACNGQEELHPRPGASLIETEVVTTYANNLKSLNGEVRGPLQVRAARELLKDDGSPILRRRLMELIDQMQFTGRDAVSLLAERLQLQVPDRQIQERIEALKDGRVESLRRALGEKTLAETQELVYGKDSRSPSPESLLGKFLAETNARAAVKKFRAVPNPNGPLGPEKLAVPITNTTTPAFFKYFGHVPEIMWQDHEPRQGTLYIMFDGKKISYAGSSPQDYSYGDPNYNTTGFVADKMLPILILATSEAERLKNYFFLGSLNQNFSKTPWEKLPGYCARGAYTCCTHWFGEMPVGDELVDAYTFPGRVDSYANSDCSPGIQRQDLADYTENPQYQVSVENASLQGALSPELATIRPSQTSDADKRQMIDSLARRVFTVPGHQQFADMLGQKGAKHRGEFANPGYVALTLIGRVKRDRNPVVFLMNSRNQLKADPYQFISAH